MKLFLISALSSEKNRDDSVFVIYIIGLTFVSNCSVKSHNGRYCAGYSPGGLFFVHLKVSAGSVLTCTFSIATRIGHRI